MRTIKILMTGFGITMAILVNHFDYVIRHILEEIKEVIGFNSIYLITNKFKLILNSLYQFICSFIHTFGITKSMYMLKIFTICSDTSIWFQGGNTFVIFSPLSDVKILVYN